MSEYLYKMQDPDLYSVDPRTGEERVAFTEDEWTMMTESRESRIAFGLEKPCGCPSISQCGYEYGACGVQEAETAQAEYEYYAELEAAEEGSR